MTDRLAAAVHHVESGCVKQHPGTTVVSVLAHVRDGLAEHNGGVRAEVLRNDVAHPPDTLRTP